MQRALQAGQRGLLLSVNGIMASICSVKDTDTPRLLLLGLLLPSVLVPSVGTATTSTPISTSMTANCTSTQSSVTTAAPITPTGNQGGSSTQPSATATTITPTITSTGNAASTSLATSTTGGSLSTPTTTMSGGTMATNTPAMMATSNAAVPNPTTSTTGGSLSISTTSNPPPATTLGIATTMAMQTVPTNPGAITAQSSATPSGSATTAPQFAGSTMMSTATMAASSASQTPVTGSTSSMMATDQTTTTSDMTIMNVTNGSNTSSWMPMLYCPSFTCNNSDCYTMYTSQNTTACNSTCRLWRMDMYHIVGCSDSCVDSCVNASHVNCLVNCCNYTGCLNDSFAMMMTTTTGSATTTRMVTTPMPVTTTTSRPTTADKTNKCTNGTCEGTNCYNDFTKLQTCASQHPHCQLMKETSGSKTMWKAGCANCTNSPVCKGSTTPPCNLECCNATVTSCLMLNGTLNVPSFATRGLCVHTELIASLIGLLAITLLL